MSKFDYYTGAFKKYATFTGRANLPEFWYFVLFNFVIGLILSFINESLAGIYNLVVLVPSLAIGARRLHDIGKSGWMQLIGLIPIIGWIWLIILFVRKGDSEENEYGTLASNDKDNEEKETFGEKVDNLTDKAKDFGEKVGDKVDDLSEKVSDKVENISEKVSDKAKDIIEDIKE